MPPRQFSRHSLTLAALNSEKQSWLLDRLPFRFSAYDDNRRHMCVQGDTLFHLASKFFKPIVRPAGLWWVIADFQPQPIHDPTIQLLPGRMLIIPSVRTVVELIFSPSRRQESIL